MESHSDAGNEELLKIISELQSKLESANAELVSEREKVVYVCVLLLFHFRRGNWNSESFNVNVQARNLAAENAKLQYRIKHLVLAVKEADHKVEQAK